MDSRGPRRIRPHALQSLRPGHSPRRQWLGGLAAIFAAAFAIALLVGDDEKVAAPNAETTGPAGSVLEIWHRPAAEPAIEAAVSTKTDGSLGEVLEVWDKPQVTPSTETAGVAGTLREVSDKPKATPDTETVGAAGTLLEAWNRPPSTPADPVAAEDVIREIWDRFTSVGPQIVD